VLYLYIPCGFVVGYLAGGWLAEHVGWRSACLWLGLPGVALAVLVRLTLREPPRGGADGALGAARAPALLDTLRFFLSRPALRHPLGGAATVRALSRRDLAARVFHAHFRDVERDGGCMARFSVWARRRARAFSAAAICRPSSRACATNAKYALWPVALLLGSVPTTLALYLAGSLGGRRCAARVGPPGTCVPRSVAALLQNLAGPERRAVAAAFYLFLVNLVSMGLGPLAVGYLSDTFTARLGPDALRYALLVIVMATTLLAALHFLLAARALRREPAGPLMLPADGLLTGFGRRLPALLQPRRRSAALLTSR
jgi:MFS family permease